MKEQMKAVYEAPVTERFQVELEGVFCASVELEDKTGNGPTINDHSINTDFDVAGFENQGWN